MTSWYVHSEALSFRIRPFLPSWRPNPLGQASPLLILSFFHLGGALRITPSDLRTITVSLRSWFTHENHTNLTDSTIRMLFLSDITFTNLCVWVLLTSHAWNMLEKYSLVAHSITQLCVCEQNSRTFRLHTSRPDCCVTAPPVCV